MAELATVEELCDAYMWANVEAADSGRLEDEVDRVNNLLGLDPNICLDFAVDTYIPSAVRSNPIVGMMMHMDHTNTITANIIAALMIGINIGVRLERVRNGNV